MSLLYMKSFRDSDGSRRNKSSGFGNSFFNKKFSSSSLAGQIFGGSSSTHHHQQQQQVQQQQQHQHQQQAHSNCLSRCDSPPGFFDEECPHHTVNRNELRARTTFLRNGRALDSVASGHQRSSSITMRRQRHHSGTRGAPSSAPGSVDHAPSRPRHQQQRQQQQNTCPTACQRRTTSFNNVADSGGGTTPVVHGRRHQRRLNNCCNSSSPCQKLPVSCLASRSSSCGRTGASFVRGGSSINAPTDYGGKIQFLAATSASIIQHTSRAASRRSKQDKEDSEGSGGQDYDDYPHNCDDDERATMLQMYNNQSKHAKEKSAGKSVTFRKPGGGGGHGHHAPGISGSKVISSIMGKGLRHFRDHGHGQNANGSHQCDQQNPHKPGAAAVAAGAMASAAGSLVAGRRLLCSSASNNNGSFARNGNDPGPSTSRMALNHGSGLNIGPLSMKDIEGVAGGLKGVETLANLTRDCFIIPVEKIGRFLPIGMMTIQQLSANASALNGTSVIRAVDKRFQRPEPCKRVMPSEGSLSSSINMIKVDESNLSFVINGLPSAMFPACSSMASGASGRSSECPAIAQRDGACRLVAKVRMDGKVSHGMLLMSMERSALYPFVSYFVINKLKVNAAELSNKIYEDTSQEFECLDGRHHFVDHFEEVAMITRPPVSITADWILSLDHLAGFIVSIFRVLPGNDGEKFERHWLYWTGARALYRSLPKCVGLKRISLLKSSGARGSVVYLLLVECSNLLENFVHGAQLLPGLRARLCGYTGIYRMIESF